MITPKDAYQLKRAMTGMAVDPDVTASSLVTALIASAPDGQPRFNFLLEIIQRDQNLMRTVLAADPNCPPNIEPPAAETTLYIPELPTHAYLSEAHIQAAEQSGKWLDDFMKWACKRSPMTPPAFLESGGLWLIGVAIARRARIVVHEPIYPHLYVLWVATSSKFAKTTGLGAVRAIADAAFPYMLMPKESTPEALNTSLAGRAPDNMGDLSESDQRRINRGREFAAQRGLLIDEASSLLGSGKKDYMQGLTEILLEAYDAKQRYERQTQKSGLLIIQRPALSILGATTPALMSRYVLDEKWHSGEMARYALLYPNGTMAFDDTFGEYNPPQTLIDSIKRLHTRLPEPPALDQREVQSAQELTATMDGDAMECYRNYRKAMHELLDEADERLVSNYSRLPTMGLKVALSLACVDWGTQAEGSPLVIRVGHWAKAQMIVERWRSSMHRLIDDLNESVDSRFQDRIVKLLKSSPAGLTIRDISRYSHINTKHLSSALSVLVESGEIISRTTQNPSGGPKMTLYQLSK